MWGECGENVGRMWGGMEDECGDQRGDSFTVVEEKHWQKTKINKHEKAHAFSLNLDVFVS